MKNKARNEEENGATKKEITSWARPSGNFLVRSLFDRD
jgi:hypothetical protein